MASHFPNMLLCKHMAWHGRIRHKQQGQFLTAGTNADDQLIDQTCA